MGGLFDIDKLLNNLSMLKKEMENSEFWNNQNRATFVNKEYSRIKKIVDSYNDILENIETLELLKDEMEDKQYDNEFINIKESINDLEIATHLNGEYDNLNCFLEIHPGAGGMESTDWASILMNMYIKFCEKYNFSCDVLSIYNLQEGGIKSCLLHIKGDNSYGYLKLESGVHRLVRISPFDSNKRRHTSFASVLITPEFDSLNEIIIKDEDLEIDVYHSSGAGGQSVNTSNSAVRITHKPTGIVVTCQNERSQLKNKEYALKILQNKLFDKQRREEEERIKKAKGEISNIDFGSQIRSYVLEPYKLVKDNRTLYENTNPDNILNGEIFEMLRYNLKNIK